MADLMKCPRMMCTLGLKEHAIRTWTTRSRKSKSSQDVGADAYLERVTEAAVLLYMCQYDEKANLIENLKPFRVVRRVRRKTAMLYPIFQQSRAEVGSKRLPGRAVTRCSAGEFTSPTFALRD